MCSSRKTKTEDLFCWQCHTTATHHVSVGEKEKELETLRLRAPPAKIVNTTGSSRHLKRLGSDVFDGFTKNEKSKTTKQQSEEEGRSSKPMSLKGKVVLITGAASGIGAATARKCAKAGARLLLADANEAGARAIRSRICEEEDDISQHDLVLLKVDVSDETQVREMVLFATSYFGRLDLAFNNAGIEGERGIINESSKANFDHVMQVNAGGVFLCMKYELQAMVDQIEKEGKRHYAIVNCASTAGLGGMPEFSAYCASKVRQRRATTCW